MTRLKAHLWRRVFTSDAHRYESYLWDRMEDFSTFVVGETGTGKGTPAAAIGRSGYVSFDERNNRFSESFMENFIEINLSQFSESLIESELFGHQKGAFTGAIESYSGVFALCSKFGSIELEQAVRCILLNKDHCSEIDGWCEIKKEPLTKILKGTNVSAPELRIAYCVSLYDEYGTYEEVARITQLDPRTVKNYIQSHSSKNQ